MLAIIKNEDGSTYVSLVLAIQENGYAVNWELIVFDESYSCFKKIEYYRKEKVKGYNGLKLYRQVWILDWEKFSFIHKSWKGLKCLVANNPLMRRLKQNEQVPVEEVPELAEYTRKIELLEWFELKTEKDIENLMMLSCGFHDCTMEEYVEDENGCTIKIGGGLAEGLVTLKFVDIIEADIVDKVGMILDSDIAKTEDGFCWKITEGFAGWTDGVDFDAPFDKPYIKCKKIFWQIEID